MAVVSAVALPAWWLPVGAVVALVLGGSYLQFVRLGGGSLWHGLDLGVYQAGRSRGSGR